MLEFIAERRIEEAVAKGELDELPGAGRALERLATGGAAAARKLSLLKARLEARYYDKVVSAFSRTPRSRA